MYIYGLLIDRVAVAVAVLTSATHACHSAAHATRMLTGEHRACTTGEHFRRNGGRYYLCTGTAQLPSSFGASPVSTLTGRTHMFSQKNTAHHRHKVAVVITGRTWSPSELRAGCSDQLLLYTKSVFV